MQTRVNQSTPDRGNCAEPDDWPEAICSLMKEIQPLVALRGIDSDALAVVFRKSLLEFDSKGITNPSDEFRSDFMGLILWRLFARGGPLWINPRTQTGNSVPLDLLVAAYSAWKSASNLAAKNGMDAIAAADTLIQVTHATADLIARNAGDPQAEVIHDVYQYLYTAYAYSVRRTATRQRSTEAISVDMGEWITRREFSDRGTFLDALEKGILCGELLDAMQPRGRSVAIARYALDCSWPETADSLGTSINAAQKALSSGFTKAFGICRQKLPKNRFRKAFRGKAQQLDKKQARVWQKMRNNHAHKK